MLTTLANVRAVPTFNSTARYSDAYLTMLVAAADAAVKKFCKRDLELKAYTEYLDGNEQPGLVLRQWPVLGGTTTVASSMDGLALPQATINVTSTLQPDGTTAFDDYARAAGQRPTISVQTGLTSWAAVQYTGTTPTSFTGCTGGTGTLSGQAGQNFVTQPVAWFDPNGFAGEYPPGVNPNVPGTGPFSQGTQLALGTNYIVDVDDGGQSSERGILRRVGGGAQPGFVGAYPLNSLGMGQGKLSSWRRPCWPRGDRNIKVSYSAGYLSVPADLTYAATMLVTYMARVQPLGASLSSESLGAYSYSVLSNSNDVPEIGSLSVCLRRYREVSW